MVTSSERRKKLREQILQRQDEAFKRKDDMGKFRSIFAERIPNEKRLKCGEGDHSFDFIPYVAGPNDPNTKEGEFAYCLDVFVHRKVGINEDDYLCLNRNFKQRCPICEYQAQLQKQGEDDAIIKSLYPTRRAIYNIWSHDNNKEEAKRVQIWDVSQWQFDSLLSATARKKKGGGYVPFADPDEGKIVSFRREGMGQNNTKYIALSFEDRDEAIPDDILDQAYCLDKLLHIPTYEEIEEAFFAGTKDKKGKEVEEERPPTVAKPKEEEKPATKRKAREPEPEPEDVPDNDNPCPEGYAFGEDFGDYDECDDCVARKDCRAEKRGGKAKPALEPEPPTRRRRS